MSVELKTLGYNNFLELVHVVILENLRQLCPMPAPVDSATINPSQPESFFDIIMVFYVVILLAPVTSVGPSYPRRRSQSDDSCPRNNVLLKTLN